MRYICFLSLVLALLLSCKKEDKKPATPVTGGSASSTIPRVKTIRVQTSNGIGGFSKISNESLTYNSQGQLISSQIIDSISTGLDWAVNNSIISYSYTTFNKISAYSVSYSFGTYYYQYLYDASNTLVAEVSGSNLDTTHYYHSGNLIIKDYTASNYTSRSYYSQNLDSSVTYINSSVNDRIVYKHNSRLDKTNQYNNQFQGIVSHKHELLSETLTYGTTNITYYSTRSYLANGNTGEVIVKLNSEVYTISRYTYY